MSATADTATTTEAHTKRPLSLSILAVYSWVLGIITVIPQLYYVLYALHLVTIGPHSNFLGYIWYAYILNGDNSYLRVDAGTLAGAVEDAFLLGPLYFATGIGLWRCSPWTLYVGLMTGAMIFHAIIGFFLGDIFAGLNTVTNGVSFWVSNLPYLIYPLCWCQRCWCAASSSREGSERRVHQGYQFCFFRTSDGDDPPAYYYLIPVLTVAFVPPHRGRQILHH